MALADGVGTAQHECRVVTSFWSQAVPQIVLHRLKAWLLPPLPDEARSAFAQDQRQIARRIVVAAAALTLLMLPVLQVLEQTTMNTLTELWWQRLMIRAPLMLMATVVLALYAWRPEGRWPRPFALLFGITLVMGGMAILVLHVAADCPDIHYIVHSLTMAFPAVALLATRGLRDLFLIYLLPLLGVALLWWWQALWRSGDMDVLVYPLLSMLVGVVLAEMLHRANRQAFAARQKLEHSATTDALTELPNRRAADALLAVEHARALRSGTGYAAIMADLDHFKRVNDTYGHDVGDEVLAELAERLRAAVRTGDHVSRWGGEEFLLLLPEIGATGAREVAEKLRASVAEAPFSTSAGALSITISLGIALCEGEPGPASVVQQADTALYRAKQEGRNRVVLAESPS